MKPNGALKGAIHERGLNSKKLAQMAAVPYTYISWALSGRFILTDDQKARIAKTLNHKVSEIFKEG
jgi:hypothetical protein